MTPLADMIPAMTSADLTTLRAHLLEWMDEAPADRRATTRRSLSPRAT